MARGRKPQQPEAPRQPWSNRIREAREKKGWSQEKLGTEIGKGQTSVGEYESSKTEPDLAMFDKIAKALGVRARWIIFGDPDEADAASLVLFAGEENQRLFAWAIHRAAALLAEEGLDSDLPYLVAFTKKVFGAAKGAANEAEAKQAITRTLEIERQQFRDELNSIRKNRI